MNAPPPRRVVTGLDAGGLSCILNDGPAPPAIWSTADVPADNRGTADAGGAVYVFPERGPQFVFADFAPGTGPLMHATDTIDYVVILSGEITLVTETGETVLRAGDLLVDRGIVHGWRNDGDVPCRLVSIMIPAHPVGAGPKLTGKLSLRRGES